MSAALLDCLRLTTTGSTLCPVFLLLIEEAKILEMQLRRTPRRKENPDEFHSQEWFNCTELDNFSLLIIPKITSVVGPMI
ncbi:hypothetical protein [Leptospira interrogans]|nr:hypothetical protein [Leptospira interrogans]MCR8649950.1 hypothetical protein [Leptospira interrogans serovar Bataviae]OAM85484.1 hypothetical protein A1343_17980 [Leptospira interrogans serovar Bataviae]QOI38661.1 hypothetical protein Lepto1548_10490 [Leptospira interrogans serovar Bataviae]QYY58947.1 hypothetical protein GR153_009720 [Leptospira interrogans serovar Bataviae]